MTDPGLGQLEKMYYTFSVYYNLSLAMDFRRFSFRARDSRSSLILPVQRKL